MITKDNAAQWLPLVRALAEGKTIQVRGDMGGWFDVVSGCLTDLRDGVARYRIKPEAKLRPWKPEEAPRCFTARARVTGHYVLIEDGKNWHTGDPIEWDFLMREFVKIEQDGSITPCGVLCEGEKHEEA